MALLGNVYIQTDDPGAVGFGYWWVEPERGTAKSRNTQNNAWVPQGNWDYVNSGNLPTSGGEMSGVIITPGAGAYAAIYSPNFSGTPKINGVNAATVADVSTAVTDFKKNLNNLINQAIASSTISIVLGNNLAFQYSNSLNNTDGPIVPVFGDGTPATQGQVRALAVSINALTKIDVTAFSYNAVHHNSINASSSVCTWTNDSGGSVPGTTGVSNYLSIAVR